MKISGLVITYNEEKYIEDCIKTLFKVCNEVIIIDSNSTDKTVELAKKLGAKVYLQNFLGDGPQRIYGLQYCTNDWILNPDADEFLDDCAIAYLQNGEFNNGEFNNGENDGYRFTRRNFIGDTPDNATCLYTDSACRFFNKKTASPSKKKVHQRISGKNIIRLHNVYINHFAWDNFNQFISKLNQYTDWQAEEYLKNNKKINFFTPIYHGVFSFLKFYLLKKGFLNGLDGLTFSIIQSFFSYIKYAKYIKLKGNKK